MSVYISLCVCSCKCKKNRYVQLLIVLSSQLLKTKQIKNKTDACTHICIYI